MASSSSHHRHQSTCADRKATRFALEAMLRLLDSPAFHRSAGACSDTPAVAQHFAMRVRWGWDDLGILTSHSVRRGRVSLRPVGCCRCAPGSTKFGGGGGVAIAQACPSRPRAPRHPKCACQRRCPCGADPKSSGAGGGAHAGCWEQWAPQCTCAVPHCPRAVPHTVHPHPQNCNLPSPC